MNVIFLSPHFPPNYFNFCVALRRRGINALAIADEPYDRLRFELHSALTEYYRVDNMQDYDQLLRACAYLTFRHGKIDRFESHNEYWLETEARIRTDFNIPGIKADTILDIKRKSRMKAKFQAAGVTVARGEIVHSIEDAGRLLATIGYPVVAKPDSGVGAANTCKIANDAELERFFATKPPVDYMMEEFINGVICSFDGLAGRDGEPVFSASHVFGHGIMETVNEDRDLFYYSEREVPADLADAGRRVLQAFDVRERFFHFEFFRTHEDNRLVALEVNVRPPGGVTVDMFNYSSDIDIYQAWADLLAGADFALPSVHKYHCGYAGRKQGKDYLRSHEEIMQNLGGLVVLRERISPIMRNALGDDGYVVRSPNLEDVQDALRFILEPA